MATANRVIRHTQAGKGKDRLTCGVCKKKNALVEGQKGNTCLECRKNPPMWDVECEDCGAPMKAQKTAGNPPPKHPRCPACREKANLPEVVSPIERELASRMLARKNLIAYILRHDPTYKVGWVHRDIAQRLERFVKDVEEGKSPRLILMMPPRSGKSREVSTEFPSWVLGQHPEWEFIAASYAVSLPIEFSRNIRERIRDPSFQVAFPGVMLHAESQSVESWKTTKGGGFLAAGVGGAITGRGAHILVVDDPIKNAEEADSANIRQSIWNWFTTTAYTRLAPGGGILVIQTRWHVDDLSGRLEAQMSEPEGEQWEIVRYPAIATRDEVFRKQGEALHPERYDLTALNRIRRAVGPRTWNALYQQSPVPDEGAFFTTEMLKYYDRAPDLLDVYNTWDLAIGKKERNDWSVGLKWGIGTDGDVYILDLVRRRMDSYEIVDAMLDLWGSDPRTRDVGIEEGVLKHAIGPYLEQRIAERKLYAFNHTALKPGRSDKEARARTVQGMMRQGRVYLPREAPWLEGFTTELLQFPYGTHDDQVDVLAYAGRTAADASTPTVDTSAAVNTVPKKWMQKLKNLVEKDKNWRAA